MLTSQKIYCMLFWDEKLSYKLLTSERGKVHLYNIKNDKNKFYQLHFILTSPSPTRSTSNIANVSERTLCNVQLRICIWPRDRLLGTLLFLAERERETVFLFLRKFCLNFSELKVDTCQAKLEKELETFFTSKCEARRTAFMLSPKKLYVCFKLCFTDESKHVI